MSDPIRPDMVERSGKSALSVLRKLRRTEAPVERISFTPTERILVKQALEAMDLQFLRVSFVEVMSELDAHPDINRRDPSTWPERYRDQAFHMLETALTVTGFNRYRAAQLLHVHGGMVEAWMKHDLWLEFMQNESRIFPMVATLKRVAVGHAMEVMTKPAVTTGDERVKAKLAGDVLALMRVEEASKGRLEHVAALKDLKQTPEALPERPAGDNVDEPGFTTKKRSVFDGEDEEA